MAQLSPAQETDVAQLPKPEQRISAVPLPCTAPAHAVGPPHVMLHAFGEPRHATPPAQALSPMHDNSH